MIKIDACIGEATFHGEADTLSPCYFQTHNRDSHVEHNDQQRLALRVALETWCKAIGRDPKLTPEEQS